ncbi:unnamed protein product [Leptidea sinapis]|uniref:Uncharacterized protein n=1 Tax=Leptidea sinapis TaxID=189913 RepID=A0A5E4PTK7_9NEOP|nr:unnamed protein product [Leptidea sinapis]
MMYFLCFQLLQNLGKVDRTLDDIFEEHLQNFNRQHQQAVRLQKEFNNYIRCIRAVQTASKSLMEAITEVYESSWSGHDLLYVQAQNMEMLWQDFSHKLGDQVLIPLNTYTNQFPEVRKKVEKRGRKLVDYDSQRHSFQNLQANAAKRRDDVKVLNSELHDELPALFDSRVLFYVNNLQTLFSAEQLFHFESSKVFAELEAITDKLATESQRGSYKKTPNNIIKTNVNSLNGNAPASPTNTVQRATLAGLPAGTLYRVRATYRYTREDSDELSFEVGDVIRVVEYDDPEEQEEGWLMGIKESTNEKGMFPANFTRPI